MSSPAPRPGSGPKIARLARFQGAHVIGMDRNDPMLTLDGYVKVDMADPAAIDAATKALPARIDGLINAAGVSGLADKELVAKVNYLGLRHLTEALIPNLQNGGAVVNITSILGCRMAEAGRGAQGSRGNRNL